MMKVIAFCLGIICIMNAYSQRVSHTFDLTESLDPEMLNILGVSDFNLLLNNNGDKCYILSNDTLAVIDIFNRSKDTIIQLDFLNFEADSKTFLLSSNLNIGILEISFANLEQQNTEKRIYFHELKGDNKIIRSTEIILKNNLCLSEADFNLIQYFTYLNDTLVFALINGQLWFVKDHAMLCFNVENGSYEFETIDIISNRIYSTNFYIDSLSTDKKIQGKIYLDDRLIIDSKDYPNKSRNRIGRINIYNNMVFFLGGDYYYDLRDSAWKNIDTFIPFNAFQVIDKGYYNYCQLNQSVTIVYW